MSKKQTTFFRNRYALRVAVSVGDVTITPIEELRKKSTVLKLVPAPRSRIR